MHGSDNKPETFKEPLEPDGYSDSTSPVVEAKVQGEAFPRSVLRADGSVLVSDGTEYPADPVGAGVDSVETGDIVDEAVTLGKMADLAQNSVIVGGASDRPTALAVAASRFLGRKATGDVDDMTAAEAAALLGIDTAVATGTIALKGLDFADGSLDAVTMGTGSVGAYRAVRTGLMVDLAIRFKIGTSPSLGTNALVIDSTDLPALYRPRLPGTDVDSLGQTEWNGYVIVNDPSRAPAPTSMPGTFGWANMAALPTGPAAAVGMFGMYYSLETVAALTDSSGGTANDTIQAVGDPPTQAEVRNNFADLAAKVNALISSGVQGIDATLAAGVMGVGGNTPFALPADARIVANIRYEAAA